MFPHSVRCFFCLQSFDDKSDTYYFDASLSSSPYRSPLQLYDTWSISGFSHLAPANYLSLNVACERPSLNNTFTSTVLTYVTVYV